MFAENPYYRRIPQYISLEAKLPPLAHHLFVIIAQKINIRTNYLQITEQELGKAASMSQSSVRRYLVPLIEKGFIEVERAPRGTRVAAIYRLAGDAARCILLESGAAQSRVEQAAPAPVPVPQPAPPAPPRKPLWQSEPGKLRNGGSAPPPAREGRLAKMARELAEGTRPFPPGLVPDRRALTPVTQTSVAQPNVTASTPPSPTVVSQTSVEPPPTPPSPTVVSQTSVEPPPPPPSPTIVTQTTVAQPNVTASMPPSPTVVSQTTVAQPNVTTSTPPSPTVVSQTSVEPPPTPEGLTPVTVTGVERGVVEAATLVTQQIDTPHLSANAITLVSETAKNAPHLSDRTIFKQQQEKEFKTTPEVVDVNNNNNSLTTSRASLENANAHEIEHDQPPLVLQGISDTLTRVWVETHGERRVREVYAMMLQQSEVYNPAGWMRRALERKWQPCQPIKRSEQEKPLDGMRYVTGRYANIIEH